MAAGQRHGLRGRQDAAAAARTRAGAVGASGQRHFGRDPADRRDGGHRGEHAVAALHQDAPAARAAAHATGDRQAAHRVRGAQPQGHVRLLLPLLQTDARPRRTLQRLLRALPQREGAHGTHLEPHHGLLDAAQRAQCPFPPLRGTQEGEMRDLRFFKFLYKN